jgi:hypothetical protein
VAPVEHLNCLNFEQGPPPPKRSWRQQKVTIIFLGSTTWPSPSPWPCEIRLCWWRPYSDWCRSVRVRNNERCVKTEDDTQDDPWCLFWPSCDASRFQSLGSLIALWIGVSPSLLVYQISLSRLLARSGMGLMTQQGQRFRLRLFFDSGTETNHYMAMPPWEAFFSTGYPGIS